MTLSAASPSINPLKALAQLSWPWRVTFIYLLFMLLLPLTALVLRASTVEPGEFWRIATDPVAVSTYEVTFGTALIAALINGVLGTLAAWVLVRYRFPFQKGLEGLIDLPFALPTAVAGLTLATVYSDNGWIGSLLAPLGIRISFTRLGVGVAMLFISFSFVVRTVQPVLQEIEKEVEEAAWSLGASRW
ncbi:MAG: sulfate ABC transporter permease subunit CysT, partial [Thermostichus sp. DG02_4_bins_136]